MALKYRTEATNSGGGDATSRVIDGMEVSVSSPLGSNPDPDATNPEQLLALSWATCLNSTAQALLKRRRRTAVRVEVELHSVESGVGYEFEVDAYLSLEGGSPEETAELLAAADARCPVSKLLAGAATARVHTEEYAAA
ncbi:OsmC family protein [Microbacterium sp. Mu-80]|uniref:OsmC family protein n=1 Tax=Microbacterium bandirmense TaxID=3122050 RepID=A0ABU8LFD3_9MICO